MCIIIMQVVADQNKCFLNYFFVILASLEKKIEKIIAFSI